MEQEGVSKAAYGRGRGAGEWHAVAVGAQIACSGCLFALVPFRHPAVCPEVFEKCGFKTVFSRHLDGISVVLVPVCKPVWDEWIVGLLWQRLHCMVQVSQFQFLPPKWRSVKKHVNSDIVRLDSPWRHLCVEINRIRVSADVFVV